VWPAASALPDAALDRGGLPALPVAAQPDAAAAADSRARHRVSPAPAGAQVETEAAEGHRPAHAAEGPEKDAAAALLRLPRELPLSQASAVTSC
jgi:hypothetical protein